MFLKRCFIIAALFLAFPIYELFAGGAKVVLHLKNGQQMTGELQAVSDSLLVIYKWKPGAEYIFEMKAREIEKVTIKSKPEIVLFLKNGEHVVGNLDSVADSSLVLKKRVEYKKLITTVGTQEIQGVMIKGQPKILKGMGLGLLIGAGIGAVYGASQDEPGLFYGLATFAGFVEGAGIGFLAGGIVATITAPRDKEIAFSANQPFAFLKPFARYPERMPENW